VTKALDILVTLDLSADRLTQREMYDALMTAEHDEARWFSWHQLHVFRDIVNAYGGHCRALVRVSKPALDRSWPTWPTYRLTLISHSDKVFHDVSVSPGGAVERASQWKGEYVSVPERRKELGLPARP